MVTGPGGREGVSVSGKLDCSSFTLYGLVIRNKNLLNIRKSCKGSMYVVTIWRAILSTSFFHRCNFNWHCQELKKSRCLCVRL